MCIFLQNIIKIIGQFQHIEGYIDVAYSVKGLAKIMVRVRITQTSLLHEWSWCSIYPHILTFYRASICEGGLGSCNSVRLSVRPSVRLTVTAHASIVTKPNDALQMFRYHTKGQSLCYSDTNSGWWATPPSF